MPEFLKPLPWSRFVDLLGWALLVGVVLGIGMGLWEVRRRRQRK